MSGETNGKPAGETRVQKDGETREQKRARLAARMVGWVRQLIEPDQFVEVRALNVRAEDGRRPGTHAGLFRGDELGQMVDEALVYSGHCSGVYFTLNPVKPPEAPSRAKPRMKFAAAGTLVADPDILCRRWMLVDVDPVRPTGVSSTDAEKAEALAVADAVAAHLAGIGWPEPVRSDSGNGYHLLFRFDDRPVDPIDSDTLRNALRALAAQFDTPAAKVDILVFNPSRIVKFPGTLACKGKSTDGRPHRRAEILSFPADPAAGAA